MDKDCQLIYEQYEDSELRRYIDDLEDFDWAYFVGATRQEIKEGDIKLLDLERRAKSNPKMMQAWKDFKGPRTKRERMEYGHI